MSDKFNVAKNLYLGNIKISRCTVFNSCSDKSETQNVLITVNLNKKVVTFNQICRSLLHRID
jgi:hypothetical protein